MALPEKLEGIKRPQMITFSFKNQKIGLLLWYWKSDFSF